MRYYTTHPDRTAIEVVAEKILDLRYTDMMALAEALSVAVGDWGPGRVFDPHSSADWARLLADWAEGVEEDFRDRTKVAIEEAAKAEETDTGGTP